VWQTKQLRYAAVLAGQHAQARGDLGAQGVSLGPGEGKIRRRAVEDSEGD
jgi:hypothetical protein